MRRSLPALAALTALLAPFAGCGGDDAPKPTTAARERPVPTTARRASEPQSPGTITDPAEDEPGSSQPEGPPREARPVAVQEGSAKGKRVALTFDADMTPDMLSRLQNGQVPEQFNREVIRRLRKTKTPATLFITGMWAKLYPKQVKKLARDPLFEIGNHTWDHKAWTGDCYGLAAVSDSGEKTAEVARTARVLTKLSGRAPFWFRFPGLCHGDEDLRIVAGEDEQVVDGLGSGDAFQRDPQVIVNTVMNEVKPGSIIVMHMMGAPNAPASGEALKTLIPALEDKGYELVSLSRLVPR